MTGKNFAAKLWFPSCISCSSIPPSGICLIRFASQTGYTDLPFEVISSIHPLPCLFLHYELVVIEIFCEIFVLPCQLCLRHLDYFKSFMILCLIISISKPSLSPTPLPYPPPYWIASSIATSQSVNSATIAISSRIHRKKGITRWRWTVR